ncbi:MAG: hypothetical protein GTN73_03925 [Candidatus Aminicenantes bacterium]|nr:hypothetical protein [Candidatus Aminicenantes bacterium]
MKKLIALFLFFSLLVLSGCVAPFSSNFTGRSLGKGKIGLEGARGLGEVKSWGGLKLAYGMTSNLDIGLQIELLTLGLFGKYSFRNTMENDFSSAALFGLGATVNGMYVYTGPVLSYKMDFFEPYFVGRYNYVHYSETEDIWSGETIEAGNYSYFQFTFGSIFWISRNAGLNFELSTFSGATGILELEGPIFMGGLKYRF